MGRILITAIAMALSQAGFAGDIDRSIADFQTPQDIKWVRNAAGTGEKYDPDGTVPVPAGSYVVH
jgi:hypothetical protein